MFASLAKGTSKIVNPLMGEDCLATLAAFKAMGIELKGQLRGHRTEPRLGPASLVIDSPGFAALHSPLVPLNFANSGTTARLMTGLLAAMPQLFVTCFGDGSLSSRPMGRVVKLLREMGANISGRDSGEFLPIAIQGSRLRGRALRSDKASAQVKSAILLAGCFAEGETSITLPDGGRDHTENFLHHLGAALKISKSNGQESIVVEGTFAPKPFQYRVPGDPSSAAFFAVLAAISGGGQVKIERMLWNATRTGFLEVLTMMGVGIEPGPIDRKAMEPVTTLKVIGKSLRAVDTGGLNPATFIDEIPILAVAAAFARGTSRFRDLHELRVKESDRLVATCKLLQKAGVRVEIEADDLIVHGQPRRLRGFRFDPDGDHRLAMAGAILGQMADGPSEILDPDCVRVSYPNFFEQLEQVRSL